MRPGSIGIENPRHFDAQPVLPPIIEKEGFGATFAFVVTRARTDRIDIAPIVFGLGMHRGIAVDFARRGLQNLNLEALCEAEHVDGADHTCLGRLNGSRLQGMGEAGQARLKISSISTKRGWVMS